MENMDQGDDGILILHWIILLDDLGMMVDQGGQVIIAKLDGGVKVQHQRGVLVFHSFQQMLHVGHCLTVGEKESLVLMIVSVYIFVDIGLAKDSVQEADVDDFSSPSHKALVHSFLVVAN